MMTINDGEVKQDDMFWVHLTGTWGSGKIFRTNWCISWNSKDE